MNYASSGIISAIVLGVLIFGGTAVDLLIRGHAVGAMVMFFIGAGFTAAMALVGRNPSHTK